MKTLFLMIDNWTSNCLNYRSHKSFPQLFWCSNFRFDLSTYPSQIYWNWYYSYNTITCESTPSN